MAEGMKKSLPKRASSAALKVRRAASWQRTQARKQVRRDDQAAREANNRTLRAAGELTAHERKKPLVWAKFQAERAAGVR